MTLGQRVRELRAERDWAQEELARRSGLDRGYIAHIEIDTIGKPAADIFLKLAHAFNIRPEELYQAAGYIKDSKTIYQSRPEPPEGILEQSPMRVIHAPRKEDKIIQPFRAEHILKLLSLCDDSFLDARNRAIILTFLDTGLRLSELTNIQLEDIDFDRETIKVMGKGAKEKIVRIGKGTQKALLRYLLMREDKNSCLWVSEERKPLKIRGIQLMIRNLGRRAGLENARCSPHTFRHTFATEALKNGAGEFSVQSLLGHSDLRMTRRYSATLKSEYAVEAHRKFSPVDNLMK